MSEQQKRKYDSTVARIAGNILSGRDRWAHQRDTSDRDADAVQWAVGMARAIVAEVERTEPKGQV